MRRLALAVCLVILWGCAIPGLRQTPPGSSATAVPAVPGVLVAVQDGRLRLLANGDVKALAPPGTVAAPSDAALAPDGSYVAAVVQDGTTSRLWVHSLRGQPDRSVGLPAQAEDVAWAPDAAHFAYKSGPGAAVVADLTGKAERITFDGDGVIGLTWGPGGRLAVLAQPAASASWRIWRWAPPGEKPTVLADDAQPHSGSPDWSPDGMKLAYVTASGLAVTSGGAGHGLLKTEDVRVVPAGNTLRLSGPKWSVDGGRVAAMAINLADSHGEQWFIASAGLAGGPPVVWTAPAYPCYVYGYWWATDTNLLVQIAGPDCSKMVVLNTGTGQTISEFPIPLKGDVRLSADRTWVAVEGKDRLTSTHLIPVAEPEKRIVVPLSGLAGWCCIQAGKS